MQTHQEVLFQALELKAAFEELKSATYIVDNYTDSNGTPFMFVAAFDIDRLTYSYTVTDANFLQILALNQLPPETLVAFGEFTGNMIKYVKGGEHPYKDKLAKFQPDVIKPHANMQDGFPTDHDIDDSNASLV